VTLTLSPNQLVGLRVQADYDPKPVSQEQFAKAYEFWAAKREHFRENLLELERLLL
jgi:hypothetical protein